jgi:hypothetical protein
VGDGKVRVGDGRQTMGVATSGRRESRYGRSVKNGDQGMPGARGMPYSSVIADIFVEKALLKVWLLSRASICMRLKIG